MSIYRMSNKGMKKAAALTAVLALFLFACGKSPEEEREIRKYREIGAYIHGIIEMQERYCNAVDAASGAKEVAAAIRQRTDDLVRLAKEVKVLEKKYPEFDIQKDKKIDDYLGEEMAAIERLKAREAKAREKVELYMDKKVILEAYNDQIARLEAQEKK